MRRGMLPYCVLAMLRDSERYGFELVQALSGINGMVTSEGTIYPLLARLRRQGLVETTWQESATGPPRRYYRLSPSGRDALADFAGSWRQFRTTVDDLLEGTAGNRQEAPADRAGQNTAAAALEPAALQPP
jgi:PadR family transcriptional regulator, regulatory protein PadR